MNTKEMLSQIKSLLNAKINLATMTLENGTVLEAESFESGQSVFIVTEDEKVPLPIGDYTMEDGKILVVAEEGIIAEIKDAMEEEKEEEEEMEDDKKDDEKEELEDVVVEDVPEEVQPEVEQIVEAVVEVIAPVIEEVKAEVEKLKEKYGEVKEDKKEEMSAKPSRKPLRHNPEAKSTKKLNKFSQNRAVSTLDRVLEKLSK